MDMKHTKARIAEEEVLPHQKCMIMRQPSKKNGTAPTYKQTNVESVMKKDSAMFHAALHTDYISSYF